MNDADQLVQKWTTTGLMRGVKKSNLLVVAERLEIAQRRMTGKNHCNWEIMNDELCRLHKEGLL